MLNTEKFIDVRNRKVVDVPLANITKDTFQTHSGQVRYCLKAKLEDGRTLTKFVIKRDWDKF